MNAQDEILTHQPLKEYHKMISDQLKDIQCIFKSLNVVAVEFLQVDSIRLLVLSVVFATCGFLFALFSKKVHVWLLLSLNPFFPSSSTSFICSLLLRF